MATLKLYLDTRYNKENAPLKLMVSHNRKSALLSLGINLSPNQWDKKACVVKNHPRKASYNTMLQHRMLEAGDKLLEYASSHNMRSATAQQLRDYISGKDDGEDSAKTSFGLNLLKFAELKSAGTKRLYIGTYNKLNEYLNGSVDGLQFSEITKEWLTKFNNCMAAEGLMLNSRNIHLRNIRAVFNYAIDNELITCYPFRRMRIKNDVTRNRAFNIEQLRTLFNWPKVEPYAVEYLDMFKLIFYLIGINITDLCHLKEITPDGRIEYHRAKTHRLYSIKVEPEAMEIINKYRGKSWLLKPLDTNKSAHTYVQHLNKALQLLGEWRYVTTTRKKEREPIFPDITTYWARHSWATIAAELDIPKETIAAALGHGMGNSTTAIYIDFNRNKIDEANRRVIDYALYDKH